MPIISDEKEDLLYIKRGGGQRRQACGSVIGVWAPYMATLLWAVVCSCGYAFWAKRAGVWAMDSWLDFFRFQTPLYLFWAIGFVIMFAAPLRFTKEFSDFSKKKRVVSSSKSFEVDSENPYSSQTERECMSAKSMETNREKLCLEKMHRCGTDAVSYAVMLLWAMGYANLLIGFFNSLLGTCLFFLFGFILHGYSQARKGIKPSFSPRLFIMATILYVAYEALTLCWSPHLARSEEYFRRELWLAVVPIALFCYPPERQLVRGFMEYALRITMLYLSSVLLLYLWLCSANGISSFACFTLSKLYLPLPWGKSSPVTLLSLFGWQHYTYLCVIFTMPFLYYAARTPLRSARGAVLILLYVEMLAFTIIMQSRICMLFLCALGVVLLIKASTRLSVFKVVVGGLIVACLVALVLAIAFPDLLGYFTDEHRRALLRIGKSYIGEHPWRGFGLASSEELIRPFMQGYNAGHFHNQWMQSYLEGGIVSAVLITIVPLSYIAIALRRRCADALLGGLFFILILLIELVFIFPEYLIGMMIMLSFLIEKRTNCLSTREEIWL